MYVTATINRGVSLVVMPPNSCNAQRMRDREAQTRAAAGPGVLTGEQLPAFVIRSPMLLLGTVWAPLGKLLNLKVISGQRE